MADSKSLGDLAENAEYHQTREDPTSIPMEIFLIIPILKF